MFCSSSGVCAASYRPLRRQLLAALLWLGCSVAAYAASPTRTAAHALWEARGAHHSVWLLGSIHMLPADDETLPDALWQAYGRSSRLLLEVDPLQVSAGSTTPEVLSAIRLPPDHPLDQLLGAQRFAKLGRLARKLGVDPAFLEGVQPWYAATTLDALNLMRTGFDPDRGVDMQLARRARADGKPLLELESVLQQYNFFAQLPYARQIAYLETTLRELPDSHREALQAVRAWRAGDVRALERQLGRSQGDDAALRAILTTERNRRWVPRIEALLDDDTPGDTLVVVGALHLVGQDGLVSLLRARGRTLEQH